MPQQIIIAEQLRIAALLTDERVDELIVAQGRYQIGDVYLGTVENVLPGIDAAFVNIGESEKNGFIHVSDLGPLRLKKNAAGITELLEPKQKVLVQVMKEPTGTKGPRLTGNIALPGRYLVLQPHGQGVNISRRINLESERNRLRALGVLVKPPGTGLLIRTEASNINEDLLIEDLENLLKQWESIQQAGESSSPPILLNRDEDFIHRILRDHIGPLLNKVIVDDNSAIERVNSFLGKNEPNILVDCHKEPNNILEHYKINSAIQNALKPRVDLPSGGYIIIEPTEALTVIDVNSGSFTRSANARETVLWTNCEAAIEIARQLKLRNIGGVIIIDFIDMDSRRDQLQLLEHFTSAIKDDASRPQIAQLTELGLVELTRKRQGQNIYELFGQKCPRCDGIGHEVVLPSNQKLNPITTSSSIIQSDNSIISDTQVTQEDSHPKRKKSTRNKNEEFASSTEQSKDFPAIGLPENETENRNTDQTIETPSSRQEPQLVAVSIEPEEEYVYSLMGFNPLLLENDSATNENITAHIVRPGEDSESIISEAKIQLLSNTSKRKKRGRNGSKSNQKSVDTPSSSSEEDTTKDNELEIKTDSIPEEVSLSVENSPEGVNEEKDQFSDIKEEDIEDPRRRRRRSSASVSDDSQ